jgi:fructokinase
MRSDAMTTTSHTLGIDLFGEVLFDCFPDGRRLLGGAPFNVAWHLQAFGAAPRLISAVGDDADGIGVQRAMRDWGMDLGGLQIDPDHPTGVVQVSLVNGEPSYEIVADRAYDHIRPPRTPDAAGLLYHGTLALRHPVSAATFQAIARGHQALRVLDVNLREPWWSRNETLALLDGADWVKLNRAELELLAETQTTSDACLAELTARFLDRHRIGGLVVTLGSEGVLAIHAQQGPVRIVPEPTEVVDTVGAGDALASVLILGLLQRWPLVLTLERAQSFATRIVAQRGATCADPALYQPYCRQWEMDSADSAGPAGLADPADPADPADSAGPADSIARSPV